MFNKINFTLFIFWYNIFVGDRMNNDVEDKIKVLIDKIRPYLISDGGNLEFIKYEDNIVYVKLELVGLMTFLVGLLQHCLMC